MFSPTAPPATDSSYSPKPNTECEDYYPTPVNHLVRSQARQLLLSGRMPLFPPAKRDWASVDEESIRLPQNLMCPPRQWRTLPADSRLIFLQYAALAILQAESGSVSLVVRDQANLAQANQFLMLPDTAGIALDPKGKARHYLFQAIQGRRPFFPRKTAVPHRVPAEHSAPIIFFAGQHQGRPHSPLKQSSK